MNKKMFSIILILSLFLISICSFSFAATEALNSTKNSVKNVGNAIGNGVKDVANGAANLGKDAVNTTQAAGNSIAGATSMNNDGMDYTATRTSADNNVMGLSSTAWTWLILGIVGIVIVALVWYYGAQYEHKNYNHE